MNNKYKFWVTLSLIAVFILGVAVGVFGDRWFLEKKKPVPRQRQEPFPTLEVISKELQLTPEQEEKIREVFKRSEERFQAFRKDVHARLTELREQLKTEMDEVFTPEQEKKMQELMDRYMRQRRREVPERRNDTSQTPTEKEKKGE
ncbi:MAG: periplasmic heavy metal sensor [Candidatus Saccharicenans sp.]|nr:periplasmic heavy metal sensor [Candidatus Saccharicenans sp.]